MSVSASDFQALSIGDSVVVLYDPSRPQKSVLYAYCDFAVKEHI